jgi:transglutaminase-like putative cysteine protease
MKKIFSRALSLLVSAALAVTMFAGTVAAADKAAVPRSSNFYLNDTPVSIAGYKFDDTNYFRLRDLAVIFSGTGSRFDLGYNASLKSGEIYPGKENSGDNTLISNLQPANAHLSALTFYVDGAPFTPEAYTINEQTYVKLRDLDSVLKFTWDWDSSGIYIYTAPLETIPMVTGDEDTLRAYLLDELTTFSTAISIGGFNLDKERITKIYEEVLYDHPELFYVDYSFNLSLYSSSLLVETLTPFYPSNVKISDLPAKVTEFRRALAAALDKIPPGLTTRESVTNINDWIVKNTTPDKKVHPTNYTAYDVLVNKRGTPGAYAAAFKLLCDARGITSRVVASASMQTAWNQVYISNYWYHVDTAMNDSYGRNVYLFLTDDEMSQLVGGFSYSDWTVKGYTDSSLPLVKEPPAPASPGPAPSPIPASVAPSPLPEVKPSPQSLPQTPELSFEKYLLEQLAQLKTTIDVSAFRLHYNEASERAIALTDTHPELFYVYNPAASTSYKQSDNLAIAITPEYAYQRSKIPAMIDTFNRAVEDALAQIMPGVTDWETVANINEYLCVIADYDNTLSRFNAYNIFVDKMAVCDGYTRAFNLLCSKFGIAFRTVTSNAMNHAWSQVYLDGAWYNVDVTWNDGYTDPDVYGNISKAFLLKTDYQFEHPESGEAHYNWKVGR